MPIFDSKAHYIRSPDLVSADMDCETVMMSIQKGEYFGIGGVGTRIWELLENPVTLNDIVGIVSTEYDIDEPTCSHDIAIFLQDLIEESLIRKG